MVFASCGKRSDYIDITDPATKKINGRYKTVKPGISWYLACYRATTKLLSFEIDLIR